MKFDNIFGNPPFQNNVTKNKTQHKLWTEFTMKAVNEWMKDGGFLGWITPQSWGSPSNKILNLFKNNDVHYLNLDTKQYFPDVGSTFSHFLLQKSNQSTLVTKIINAETEYNLVLDDNILWIPNDFCDHSLNIHRKVMFLEKDKFIIHYDYVTCHNVIRRAEILKNNKLTEYDNKINSCKDDTKKEKLLLNRKNLLEKKVDITISESMTQNHIYPVFHTNKKIWYSSIQQSFAKEKKVLWSRSGYVKAIYDPGNLGCTDMGYYILVDSDVEGERLARFLNSKLMQYIFKTAKWSGFGNEKVFSSIPKIDLSKDYTEQDFYDMFSLTKEEVSFLNLSKKKKKTNIKKETISEKRIKEYGEVYTPKELVVQILNLVDDERWKDKKQTFIDPACGNGNFLVNILQKRINSNIDIIDAISTLYGVDILEDNIQKCKERLLQIVLDSELDMDIQEIRLILNKNIIRADSLQENYDVLFMKKEEMC